MEALGIDVSLEGPTPWHVHGTASLSFFFFSIDIGIDFTWESDTLLRIEATARLVGRTGVEMEALTAVSVAALTIYDMFKAVDRTMTIERIRLEEKSGGRSGLFRRAD